MSSYRTFKNLNLENSTFKRVHLVGGLPGDWFTLPFIPDYASNNAHMFYLVCRNLDERSRLIGALKEAGIMAVFHDRSLHSSPYRTDAKSHVATK